MKTGAPAQHFGASWKYPGGTRRFQLETSFPVSAEAEADFAVSLSSPLLEILGSRFTMFSCASSSPGFPRLLLERATCCGVGMGENWAASFMKVVAGVQGNYFIPWLPGTYSMGGVCENRRGCYIKASVTCRLFPRASQGNLEQRTFAWDDIVRVLWGRTSARIFPSCGVTQM